MLLDRAICSHHEATNHAHAQVQVYPLQLWKAGEMSAGCMFFELMVGAGESVSLCLLSAKCISLIFDRGMLVRSLLEMMLACQGIEACKHHFTGRWKEESEVCRFVVLPYFLPKDI